MIAWAWLALALLPADAPTDTAERLSEAFALVEALRCEDAITALEPLVREDVDPPSRRRALFLRGYCLAVVYRDGPAREDFRAAWSLDLDAPQDIEAEPRVQAFINDERTRLIEARDAERRAARDALVRSIRLTVLDDESHLTNVVGGQRIMLAVRVTDPKRAVAMLRVEFRLGAEREFYSLPLRKGRDDVWRGEIPGAYTRTPTGALQVFWLLVASDDKGELLTTLHTREAPAEVFVAKGSEVADLPARERLPHAQRLLFAGVGLPAAGWFASTATGLGLAAVGTVALPLLNPPRDADDDSLRPLFAAVALVINIVPSAVGAFAVYAGAQVLLDGWGPWVPTALAAVPAVLTGVAMGLFFGVLALMPPVVDNGEIAEIPTSYLWGGPVFSSVVMLLVAVPLGVTATVMVGLDAPGAE